MITKSADKTPKIEVEVTRIQEVSDIIKRFTFTPVDRAPLPVFGGGAHIVVEMQDGDVLRRNPYSLVSKPGSTENYQISVRRDDVGRREAEVDQSVQDEIQKLADFLGKKKARVDDKARPAFDTAELNDVYIRLLRAATSARST